MSLRLVPRTGAIPAGVRFDAPVLSPDALAGLSPDEAARRPVGAGTVPVPLGDLFAIDRGDPADPGDTITIEGGLESFARVAAGMSHGRMSVRGGVGPRAGSAMRGGALTIAGDAGPRAGEGMTGGVLRVGGSAGDRLGAPIAGRPHGMNGGVILVRGTAGALAAFRMRRGTVVVGGAAGPAAGAAMIAGTLVLMRPPGPGAGALMRRGTIVALRPCAPPASFAPAGTTTATFLKPWWDALTGAGVPLPAGLAAARFARHVGDLGQGGLGEILILEET